jgi:aryl-alcohol dehydrogenase-like predicted oxidoreductase
MRYATYGRTGLSVSRLSMGCNRLGDPGVDPAQWPPIVQKALDLGITFFDTSENYNEGRSEAVLGEVTSTSRIPVVIATKGGFSSGADIVRDFSEESILKAARASLKRLQRSTIELYMLHSPTVAQLENDTWPNAIETLKAEGTIKHFGISTTDHASGVKAIEMGADFLQIEYDLLDPTAEDVLLPLARKHDIGIMIRTPLARGLLSGKFPADGQTLAQAALRWLLAQSSVHCVIPGARTIEQLKANVGAVDGDVTADELEQVASLHQQWRSEGRW